MKRICRICETSFVLTPDKPGRIDECLNCVQADVPKLMAKVAWSGKHTMEMEITADRKAAMKFNRQQRRNGPGPLNSIVEVKEGLEGRESSKSGSGAELGAQYVSNLGEKRRVKI